MALKKGREDVAELLGIFDTVIVGMGVNKEVEGSDVGTSVGIVKNCEMGVRKDVGVGVVSSDVGLEVENDVPTTVGIKVGVVRPDETKEGE